MHLDRVAARPRHDRISHSWSRSSYAARSLLAAHDLVDDDVLADLYNGFDDAAGLDRPGWVSRAVTVTAATRNRCAKRM